MDVQRVFEHLDNIDLAQIRDPMGISGYISPCGSSTQLLEAKSKVSTARTRATKACGAEILNNIREAFDWWDKLFAYRFPNYYYG